MNERIRELRKKLNLTMEKFGIRLGVGKTAISKLENGERNLTDQMLKSICREFNVNETWLRTGEGEMFVELDMENQLMAWAGKVLGGHDSKFKKRFVTMLMGLSDKEWDMLERKVKEFAKELEEDKPQD